MLKTYLVFALVLVLLPSCEKENCTPSVHQAFPVCLKALLEDSANMAQLVTIKGQLVKNEVHYWLNTDFGLVDGPEFIINESCDTVCLFPGRAVPPDCLKSYTFEKWITLWKK